MVQVNRIYCLFHSNLWHQIPTASLVWPKTAIQWCRSFVSLGFHKHLTLKNRYFENCLGGGNFQNIYSYMIFGTNKLSKLFGYRYSSFGSASICNFVRTFFFIYRFQWLNFVCSVNHCNKITVLHCNKITVLHCNKIQWASVSDTEVIYKLECVIKPLLLLCMHS